MTKKSKKAEALDQKRREFIDETLQGNPVKMLKAEVFPWNNGTKILRVGISATDEFLEVLQQVAKLSEGPLVNGGELRSYIQHAVEKTLETDLDTPQELGLNLCNQLKEKIKDGS